MLTQKRDYKSSLFVNMFGRNVYAKEHFLSLYNAIHDTNFKIGEVEIKPVMLDNVVYNNIENDVSMEIKLPRPECYVFYNGDAAFPQEKEMKLSDAFKDIKESSNLKDLPESISLDLTVKVYNINKEANHPILRKCEALLAYSNFTEYARIGKQRGEKNPPK